MTDIQSLALEYGVEIPDNYELSDSDLELIAAGMGKRNNQQSSSVSTSSGFGSSRTSKKPAQAPPAKSSAPSCVNGICR